MVALICAPSVVALMPLITWSARTVRLWAPLPADTVPSISNV